ncbi:MAG: dihydrodipicolinate reductase [Myxococcota bacterium]
MTRVHRVVQWTTGKTGAAAVRGMVGRPDIELVGCYAWSADKVGRDAGTLCGIAPIGVVATDDVDALLALRPDCVAYMPYRPDFDHVERILRAGANVVTTMYMLAGEGYGEDVARRIREAALAGGASLYAGGIYPGHAPNVALAVSAMCSRIDRLTVRESVQMAGYANERMFRAMGIDLLPDDPAARATAEASCGSFKDQVRVLARALGVALDGIGFDVHFATANADIELGFMTVRKGRVAAFQGVVSGVVRGEPRIELEFVWKLGQGMTPEWPVEDGYRIELHGEPGVRCRLEPLGPAHLDGAVTTAMPLVHAIPRVCAAPPGIVNAMDLPFVVGAHAVGRPAPARA